jgi:integrase
MRLKLSDRVIERKGAPPTGKAQHDIFDTRVHGLGLCCGKAARTWFIFYRDPAGKSHRTSIGRYPELSVEQARDVAEVKLKEARAGVVNVEKLEATMAELIERYLMHARLHKQENSFKQDEGYLRRNIDAQLRAQKLSAITVGTIEKLNHDVGSARGKSAANHLIRCLKRMFSLAKAWGMVGGDNPCTGVQAFKMPPRERFLTWDEVDLVHKALVPEGDWRIRSLFPMLIATGRRKSELLKLRWDQIDFGAGTLRLRRAKNNKQLLIPLPEAILQMLRALPTHGVGELVFPGNREGQPLKDINGAWDRIRSRVGLTDVTIHALRHSFASLQLQAGTPLIVVSKLLGHSSLAMSERYSHLQIEQMKGPMESHAARILSVTQEQSGVGSTESSETLRQVGVSPS